MSLMACTLPNERLFGPVRKTGSFLCSLARCVERLPPCARIMNGRFDMPEKVDMVGNFRKPGPCYFEVLLICFRRVPTFGIAKVMGKRVHEEERDCARGKQVRVRHGTELDVKSRHISKVHSYFVWTREAIECSYALFMRAKTFRLSMFYTANTPGIANGLVSVRPARRIHQASSLEILLAQDLGMPVAHASPSTALAAPLTLH